MNGPKELPPVVVVLSQVSPILRRYRLGDDGWDPMSTKLGLTQVVIYQEAWVFDVLIHGAKGGNERGGNRLLLDCCPPTTISERQNIRASKTHQIDTTASQQAIFRDISNGFPCRKSSALSRVLPQDQQSSNDVYLRRRYMTGRVEQCNYVSSTRYRRVVVWAGNNVCLPPLTLPVPSGSVAYKPDLPDVERLMGNL
ncbi:hypothetical protein HYQ46_004822 [Verticillium longisporum]|nr:hypothetical protein HYQ46_004822 [Verticillium longisporum]